MTPRAFIISLASNQYTRAKERRPLLFAGSARSTFLNQLLASQIATTGNPELTASDSAC